MRHFTYFKGLQYNLRAYILASAVILSLLAVSWLRLSITSDQLFLIRLQQVYGLFAVLLLYGAVLLTPLSKVFKGKKWFDVVLFSRRAIGVSAAYFTVLHTAVALIDQVGGLGNLVLLPERFKIAFLLGGVALLILMLMALTSFDWVIDKMTFKRWKRLHQFVYLAGVLIIVHVWLIGTHADISGIRITSATLLALLFALEANRLVLKYAVRFNLSDLQRRATKIALFMVMFSSLWLLPLFAGNYHSQHTGESSVKAGH